MCIRDRYNLTYMEPQKPPENVKFQFKDKKTGDSVIVEKSIKELNDHPETAYKSDTWDIKHTEGKKLEE